MLTVLKRHARRFHFITRTGASGEKIYGCRTFKDDQGEHQHTDDTGDREQNVKETDLSFESESLSSSDSSDGSEDEFKRRRSSGRLHTGLHVDTHNKPYRYVTALTYLADVPPGCGGETVFPCVSERSVNLLIPRSQTNPTVISENKTQSIMPEKRVLVAKSTIQLTEGHTSNDRPCKRPKTDGDKAMNLEHNVESLRKYFADHIQLVPPLPDMEERLMKASEILLRDGNPIPITADLWYYIFFTTVDFPCPGLRLV